MLWLKFNHVNKRSPRSAFAITADGIHQMGGWLLAAYLLNHLLLLYFFSPYTRALYFMCWVFISHFSADLESNAKQLVPFQVWFFRNLMDEEERHSIAWITKANNSPPGQNGRHFADDIFRCIFVNEKFFVLIKFHWSFFLRVQLTINQH